MAKAGGPDKDRGGKVSPDGLFMWNGTVWQRCGAVPVNTLTPNGGFYFDGTTWMAVPSPPSPVAPRHRFGHFSPSWWFIPLVTVGVFVFTVAALILFALLSHAHT